jgi:hypothetical protein
MKNVAEALAKAKKASDNYLTPIINSANTPKIQSKDQDACMDEEEKQ